MTNFRENYETFQNSYLSEYACRCSDTKGRKIEEEKCTIRTDFQRDRDRILHSKAFRRLKHKTQVFLAPQGDHFRTRLTHTLEVSQIARTIARALRLNEDLVEAISLGHDLGHTPFGHAGESALNEKCKDFGGFKHYKQSLRVVDVLEKRNGRFGLNLCEEVRDGILNHSGQNEAFTLEGKLVKFADRIAYINHDIDDAIRAGILSEKDIPKDLIEILGDSHSKRINTLITDILNESYGQNHIAMSKEIGEAMEALRAFMFKEVYFNPITTKEHDKAKNIISMLYDYYVEHPEKLPDNIKEIDASLNQQICDYIAGMSDIYAINEFNKIYVPQTWKNEVILWK